MAFSVGIGLTNECNLQCPHCYRPDMVVDRLSLDDVKRVCDSIPVRSMNLGVGENGLHQEYEAILAYLADRQVRCSITSNGKSIERLLATMLLPAPLLALGELSLSPVWLGVLALTIGVATCGPGTLLVYGQRVLYPDWPRSAWWLPTIMTIGVGVAWSTTVAVFGAFWDRDREFIRTPKFGIGSEGGHWRGRVYVGRRDWGSVVEILLSLYCAWTIWFFWRQGSYGALPFLALYATGFLTVGILTIRHTVARPRRDA